MSLVEVYVYAGEHVQKEAIKLVFHPNIRKVHANA